MRTLKMALSLSILAGVMAACPLLGSAATPRQDYSQWAQNHQKWVQMHPQEAAFYQNHPEAAEHFLAPQWRERERNADLEAFNSWAKAHPMWTEHHPQEATYFRTHPEFSVKFTEKYRKTY